MTMQTGIIEEMNGTRRRARGFGLIATALAAGLIVAAPTASAEMPRQRQAAISFGLAVGERLVGCGAPLSGLGIGRASASLNGARLYVSDVKLIDSKGARVPIRLTRNDWQFADVALLDFKDGRGGRTACSKDSPAKNTTVLGTVPKGSYAGLQFTVGVPVTAEVDGETIALNHSNLETAPAPLDIAVMNWSWQAGRKFLLAEVNPTGGFKRQDGSPAHTWMVHLGSTGCKGNPATGEIIACARPNRFVVTLERFDPRSQMVVLDLAKLFADSDLAADKGGAIGCMSDPSDPECGAIFQAIGLNLNETRPGAGDEGRQTIPGRSSIFKVLAKP
jgi:uncharacterized repeat protein (TIGR04052 family)